MNRGCRCGPVLNSKKVTQLPEVLGPGSIRRVLRAAVQACVDCCYDQSIVYNLLREGNGRVVISGQIPIHYFFFGLLLTVLLSYILILCNLDHFKF